MTRGGEARAGMRLRPGLAALQGPLQGLLLLLLLLTLGGGTRGALGAGDDDTAQADCVCAARCELTVHVTGVRDGGADARNCTVAWGDDDAPFADDDGGGGADDGNVTMLAGYAAAGVAGEGDAAVERSCTKRCCTVFCPTFRAAVDVVAGSSVGEGEGDDDAGINGGGSGTTTVSHAEEAVVWIPNNASTQIDGERYGPVVFPPGVQVAVVPEHNCTLRRVRVAATDDGSDNDDGNDQEPGDDGSNGNDDDTATASGNFTLSNATCLDMSSGGFHGRAPFMLLTPNSTLSMLGMTIRNVSGPGAVVASLDVLDKYTLNMSSSLMTKISDASLLTNTTRAHLNVYNVTMTGINATGGIFRMRSAAVDVDECAIHDVTLPEWTSPLPFTLDDDAGGGDNDDGNRNTSTPQVWASYDQPQALFEFQNRTTVHWRLTTTTNVKTHDGSFLLVSGQGSNLTMTDSSVRDSQIRGTHAAAVGITADVDVASLRNVRLRGVDARSGVTQILCHSENATVQSTKADGLVLSGVTITDGKAGGDGGAVHSTGCPLTVNEDSHIKRNKAEGRGGGIFIQAAPLFVTETEIRSNKASRAGAVYFDDAGLGRFAVTMQHSSLTANVADNKAGALYISSSTNRTHYLTDVYMAKNSVDKSSSGTALQDIYLADHAHVRMICRDQHVVVRKESAKASFLDTCVQCGDGKWGDVHGDTIGDTTYDCASNCSFVKSSVTADDLVDECYSCPNPSACKGGRSCSSGYQDVLCAECKSTFYIFTDEICKRCSTVSWMLFSLVCLVICIVYLLTQVDVTVQHHVRLKLLTTFAQLTGYITQFNVHWPDFVSTFGASIFAMGFSVHSTAWGCVGDGNFHIQYIAFLGLSGFILFILVLIESFLWRSAYRTEKKGLPATVQRSRARTAGQVLCCLAVSLYAPMLQLSLYLFRCRDGPDGHVLIADSTIECNDSGHAAIQVLGACTIAVVGVGLPIIMFLSIRRLQRAGALYDPYKNTHAVLWYGTYNQSCPYFEVVGLVRRAVIVVPIVMTENPTFQGLCSFWTHALYIVLIWHLRPYRHFGTQLFGREVNFNDLLDGGLAAVLAGGSLMGAFISSTKHGGGEGMHDALAAIFVTTNSILVGIGLLYFETGLGISTAARRARGRGLYDSDQLAEFRGNKAIASAASRGVDVILYLEELSRTNEALAAEIASVDGSTRKSRRQRQLDEEQKAAHKTHRRDGALSVYDAHLANPLHDDEDRVGFASHWWRRLQEFIEGDDDYHDESKAEDNVGGALLVNAGARAGGADGQGAARAKAELSMREKIRQQKRLAEETRIREKERRRREKRRRARQKRLKREAKARRLRERERRRRWRDQHGGDGSSGVGTGVMVDGGDADEAWMYRGGSLDGVEMSSDSTPRSGRGKKPRPGDGSHDTYGDDDHDDDDDYYDSEDEEQEHDSAGGGRGGGGRAAGDDDDDIDHEREFEGDDAFGGDAAAKRSVSVMTDPDTRGRTGRHARVGDGARGNGSLASTGGKFVDKDDDEDGDVNVRDDAATALREQWDSLQCMFVTAQSSFRELPLEWQASLLPVVRAEGRLARAYKERKLDICDLLIVDWDEALADARTTLAAFVGDEDAGRSALAEAKSLTAPQDANDPANHTYGDESHAGGQSRASRGSRLRNGGARDSAYQSPDELLHQTGGRRMPHETSASASGSRGRGQFGDPNEEGGAWAGEGMRVDRETEVEEQLAAEEDDGSPAAQQRRLLRSLCHTSAHGSNHARAAALDLIDFAATLQVRAHAERLWMSSLRRDLELLHDHVLSGAFGAAGAGAAMHQCVGCGTCVVRYRNPNAVATMFDEQGQPQDAGQAAMMQHLLGHAADLAGAIESALAGEHTQEMRLGVRRIASELTVAASDLMVEALQMLDFRIAFASHECVRDSGILEDWANDFLRTMELDEDDDDGQFVSVDFLRRWTGTPDLYMKYLGTILFALSIVMFAMTGLESAYDLTSGKFKDKPYLALVGVLATLSEFVLGLWCMRLGSVVVAQSAAMFRFRKRYMSRLKGYRFKTLLAWWTLVWELFAYALAVASVVTDYTGFHQDDDERDGDYYDPSAWFRHTALYVALGLATVVTVVLLLCSPTGVGRDLAQLFCSLFARRVPGRSSYGWFSLRDFPRALARRLSWLGLLTALVAGAQVTISGILSFVLEDMTVVGPWQVGLAGIIAACTTTCLAAFHRSRAFRTLCSVWNAITTGLALLSFVTTLVLLPLVLNTTTTVRCLFIFTLVSTLLLAVLTALPTSFVIIGVTPPRLFRPLRK